MKRAIDSLKIYCPHRSKGCDEITTLGECNQHLEKCGFEEVECSEKCGEKMLQKELQDHQSNQCSHRQVNCQYCQSKGMYKDISSMQHIQKCPSYPLPCRKNCGQKEIKRKDISAHRQVCPLELVKCSFSEAGCGDVPRKDLEAHIASSTQQHLALVILTTMKMTKKNLTEELRSTQQDL